MEWLEINIGNIIISVLLAVMICGLGTLHDQTRPAAVKLPMANPDKFGNTYGTMIAKEGFYEFEPYATTGEKGK